MTTQKTVIMGFGNPVRSDDAIGVYVAQALQQKLANYEHIKVFDMGTSGFDILFQLKGYEKIIVVDGVLYSNEPDGTLFCLPASEIKSQIQDDPLVFLHTIKWDQALSYAKKIMQTDFPENNILAYLIAITNTKLEMQLSEVVQAAGDELVEKIVQHLNE